MKYSLFKKILYAVLLIFVAMVFYLVWTWINPKTNVGAKTEHKVDICHFDGKSGNYQDLNIDEHSADDHLENHDKDYEGKCNTEYHWVKDGQEKVGDCTGKCESREGTQTHSQSYECKKVKVGEEGGGGNECKKDETTTKEWTEACVVEEPTACEEPSPAPEPSPEPKKEFSGSSAPQSPACENLGGSAPTIIKFWREDPDTVGFEWSKPRDQAKKYILWYGLTENSLPYNKIVEGQSTTIDLPDHPNVNVWGAVQETDGNCVGRMSVPVDP